MFGQGFPRSSPFNQPHTRKLWRNVEQDGPCKITQQQEHTKHHLDWSSETLPHCLTSLSKGKVGIGIRTHSRLFIIHWAKCDEKVFKVLMTKFSTTSFAAFKLRKLSKSYYLLFYVPGSFSPNLVVRRGQLAVIAIWHIHMHLSSFNSFSTLGESQIWVNESIESKFKFQATKLRLMIQTPLSPFNRHYSLRFRPWSRREERGSAYSFDFCGYGRPGSLCFSVMAATAGAECLHSWVSGAEMTPWNGIRDEDARSLYCWMRQQQWKQFPFLAHPAALFLSLFNTGPAIPTVLKQLSHLS